MKEFSGYPLGNGKLLEGLSRGETWSVLCVNCWLHHGSWFGIRNTMARKSSERVKV
jgi:hypothetical protein